VGRTPFPGFPWAGKPGGCSIGRTAPPGPLAAETPGRLVGVGSSRAGPRNWWVANAPARGEGLTISRFFPPIAAPNPAPPITVFCFGREDGSYDLSCLWGITTALGGCLPGARPRAHLPLRAARCIFREGPPDGLLPRPPFPPAIFPDVFLLGLRVFGFIGLACFPSRQALTEPNLHDSSGRGMGKPAGLPPRRLPAVPYPRKNAPVPQKPRQRGGIIDCPVEISVVAALRRFCLRPPSIPRRPWARRGPSDHPFGPSNFFPWALTWHFFFFQQSPSEQKSRALDVEATWPKGAPGSPPNPSPQSVWATFQTAPKRD